MGSSGKKKTTMAKLARENRLRERRLNKQAKRDARKQASSHHLDVMEGPLEAGMAHSIPPDPLAAGVQPAVQPPTTDDREDTPEEVASGSIEQPIGLARVEGDDPPDDGDTREPNDDPASAPGPADEAVRAFGGVDPEPSDPRDREVALLRLRDAPDEELAVFEGELRDNALEAGATEREMRDAQRNHPGHGA